ncbi:Alpha/Beta hydrolase protein [Apiospora sp. TS-2023a]
MFLKPTLSFTIPSVHDGHKLDCRVFHPASLLTPPSSQQSEEDDNASSAPPPWGRHIAIVAHPYAPLGGSYDDPIVDVISGILVQAGFVVATFNFRGASKSGGRTSWTSKPEQGDYMSVVGFLAYYTRYLDIPSRTIADKHPAPSPTLLQCGYSYGATVTTKIPPLDSILALFHSPAVHTSAADIRLRAQHLAEQQNRLAAMPISPRKSLGMRIGGDEDTKSPRKSSQEVRRSRSFEREDKIRKGVKDILGRSKLCLPDGVAPIGLMTNLATMSIPNPFGSLSRKRSRGTSVSEGQETSPNEAEAAEQKLVRNPTLVVYGDQDGMAQVHKFREWAARLKGYAGSQFLDVEISGAGHFWWEEGVIYQLRSAIETYAKSLARNEATQMHTSSPSEKSAPLENPTLLDTSAPAEKPALPESPGLPGSSALPN